MNRIQDCKEVTENITGTGGGIHPSHCAHSQNEEYINFYHPCLFKIQENKKIKK